MTPKPGKGEHPKGRDALLDALAAGMPLAKAAAVAGISERTAKRRRVEKGFREELTARRGQLLEEATTQLTGLLGAAVEHLADLMADPKLDPRVRLGAVRAALEFALSYRKEADLEARLAEVEEALRRMRELQGGAAWTA